MIIEIIDTVLLVFAVSALWKIATSPIVFSPSVLPAQTKVQLLTKDDSVSIPKTRATVLQKQPDLSWSVVGDVDFESRENPGERITRELKSENRAIMWPDGTIEESKPL